ncbi:neuroglobin [Culex quinquefasciatus]|uniref:Neuroglobin n=1 Tax=Culex quinquefasciatus TaxID=7176 RepID=B0WEN6_CULQU|nr:neuroglobin [Culex quinquefasciatus]|eukprot:XP_001847170.1 neuroglobin [Culex quinquefasciatus]
MGCELTKLASSNGGGSKGNNVPSLDACGPPPTDSRLPLTAKQKYTMVASWKGISRAMETTGIDMFINCSPEQFCTSSPPSMPPSWLAFSIDHRIEEPFLSAVENTLGDRYTQNVEGIYKLTIKFIIETLVTGFESSANNNDDVNNANLGTRSSTAATAKATASGSEDKKTS